MAMVKFASVGRLILIRCGQGGRLLLGGASMYRGVHGVVNRCEKTPPHPSFWDPYSCVTSYTPLCVNLHISL